MYAISVEAIPGRVTMISPAEDKLASQILVDSLPAGYALGDIWYIGGAVVKTEDLTAEQKTALGLVDVEEDETETTLPSGYEFNDATNGISIGDTPSESEEEADTGDDSSLAGIGGAGVLVNITMNQAGWSVDSETGKYVHAIASSHITNSTVLYVTGVNRQMLNAHIYWKASAGLITFETALLPSGAIQITGVLSETGDEWTASGVIECWPGAGLVSKRFRQSLNAANWSVSLAARGTEGDTKTILTGVGFANANLLFATPEWTGNTHVVIPSVWVHDDYQRLCYTLTNLSDEQVTITEVALRLLFSGTVSNLTEEAQDSSALSGYISEIDIDELE